MRRRSAPAPTIGLTLRAASATPVPMSDKPRDKFRVAAVQMTSTPELEANLATAQRLCNEAIDDGAGLVVLPECLAWLGPEQAKLAIAESLPEGGPILARFQQLAAARKAELVLGGFWERASEAGKV